MENKKANFNWFPGHMNKSIKEMEKQIKIFDFIIYIVDARAPISTKNNLLNNIVNNKKIIYILSKTDISDENITKEWIEFFKKNNICFLLSNFNAKKEIKKKLISEIYLLTKEIIENKKKKGYEKIQLNALVVGIPNVGKSSFINNLVGTQKANAANIPGLTKGMQRIKLNDEIFLIDSPGIAPSKFNNYDSAINCAAANCLKIFDTNKNEISFEIFFKLQKDYYLKLKQYFGIEFEQINIFDEKKIQNFFKLLNLKNNKDEDSDFAINHFMSCLLSYKIKGVSFEKPRI